MFRGEIGNFNLPVVNVKKQISPRNTAEFRLILHTPGPEYLHNGKVQCYISTQLNLLSSSCSAHRDKKYAYFG